MAHRPAKLKPEQIPLWAASYIQDFNASRVAREFGYNERDAAKRGYEVMQDPEVQAAVKAAIEARAAEVKLDSASVLAELKKLVFFDPRKLFREDGHPKDITELDDDTAKCLAGLEVATEREDGGEEGPGTTTYIRKYKLVSKTSAIDMALKHLGEYRPDTVELGEKTLEALVGGSMPKDGRDV